MPEKSADQSSGPIAGKAGRVDQVEQAAERAPEQAKADETVWLVHCNISPAAVKQRTSKNSSTPTASSGASGPAEAV